MKFKNLITKFQRVKKLLGRSEKITLKSEIKSGHLKSFRRQFFNKDIAKGKLIKDTDECV